MRSRLLLVLFGTLLASACSTKMTKDECRTVDWRTVGYEDGVAGRSGDRIGEHRRACAEHGVTPDLNAYLAGRDAGLREYCQPHNGYRAGVNGNTYYDTCPADLAAAFEAGQERRPYLRGPEQLAARPFPRCAGSYVRLAGQRHRFQPAA